MIQNMITEGKIVPSEVTIKLLQRAMLESENDKFLIDGFPRNEENRAAFERVVSMMLLPIKSSNYLNFIVLIYKTAGSIDLNAFLPVMANCE